MARLSGRATILELGLRTLLRCLRPAVDYEVICTSDVTIETLRRHSLRAAVDGELERLNSPPAIFCCTSASLCPRSAGETGRVRTLAASFRSALWAGGRIVGRAAGRGRATAQRPDLVVVSGDFTQRARRRISRRAAIFGSDADAATGRAGQPRHPTVGRRPPVRQSTRTLPALHFTRADAIPRMKRLPFSGLTPPGH